jgi:type II secretory pathway component PulC
MQDKRSQYINYLVSCLVITLLMASLLASSITNTNAQEESLTIPSSIKHGSEDRKLKQNQSIPSKVSQHDVPDISEDHSLKDSNGIEGTKDELKDITTLIPLQIDLRLAGTVLVGKEYHYALIVEETTGRQKLYSVGESIRGAKLLKIGKESIVVEKDGRTHVLRITGGSYTEVTPSEVLSGNEPPTIGVSEELPFFEPVFSETGPPVDENIHVEELPPFEPITNSTDPPVDPEGLYEDLPEFVPFENDSGPPGV